MSRLNTYIFRQMLAPFLFFVLVFTGVIWLSQSLRIIDTVVNNGQSAMVFLEFTLLLLPRVMVIVLPVAAFAATLYAINRLYTDSEVVVMFSSGVSGVALLRPVATFGVLVMAAVYATTLFIVPLTQQQMRERISEIRGDVAAAFIREGTFLTPVDGVTVYLRETGRPGEMLGIFVHDTRDPEQIATYTAERALLLSDDGGTRLVMFDGVTQIAIAEGEGQISDGLSVLRFNQLAYDLTELTDDGEERAQKPSEMYIDRLLTITEEETGNRTLGDFRAEGHEALSAPLYVLALPLLAVAIVISAGFKRRGFGGRIVVAVTAALGLRLLGLAAKSSVSSEAALWPLLYVPPVIGVAVALWLLSVAPAAGRRQQLAAPGSEGG